jgi:hypothetical protein
MSDTELLDGIERHGISLWPDRESRIDPNAKISEWNTFARGKGNPVQKTRATLRAAVVDTLKQLQNQNERRTD